ncbi:MAG: type III pantothenate kinase [Acidobacteriota bacterium]|jgi:type III pantothenate kinase|nr:type III pantothenate kinase [Acidobacteriota bacterium]
MLLVVDIGNTSITIGLYKTDKLGPRWRLASDNERTSDEYGILMIQLLEQSGIRPEQVNEIAIASVVPPLTGTIENACRDYLNSVPLIVDAGTRTGIPLRYEDPKQVGADRVVNAAAVRRLYKGPICVVDFGTATIFDAISAEGEYLGGAIAPGIGIASDALFRRAAKLPRVEILRPPAAIGRNTVHSLQSGLLYGYVGLVDGMVNRFRAELGPDMKTVGTGALVELIARETRSIDMIEPWLALQGLKIIYDLNRAVSR